MIPAQPGAGAPSPVLAVAFSPDGAHVAWIQGDEVLFSRVNELTAQRVNLSLATTEMAWFPDGQALVVVARRGEQGRNLVRIGLDGTVTTLTSGERWVGAPVVDPGGRLVLYAAAATEEIDIFGHLADRPAAVPLIAGPGAQIPLALSDDGRFLVHLERRGARGDLWVHDFRLGAGLCLTRGLGGRREAGWAVTTARWLPHSTSVAFAVEADGEASLWVVDIADPKPDRLWRDRGVVTDLEWSPHGRDLLFCAAGQLHQITDRGRRHRVLEGLPWNVPDVALAPGGDRVALAGARRPVIRVLRELSLASSQSPDFFSNWSPLGDWHPLATRDDD